MTKRESARGRPPLTPSTSSVRITVCVTAGQRLRLRRVATARGRRFSEVVREAIDDRIDRDDDDDRENS